MLPLLYSTSHFHHEHPRLIDVFGDLKTEMQRGSRNLNVENNRGIKRAKKFKCPKGVKCAKIPTIVQLLFRTERSIAHYLKHFLLTMQCIIVENPAGSIYSARQQGGKKEREREREWGGG